MEPSLKLVEPACAHRKAFLATVADYQASGENRYPPLLEMIRADFRGYVHHLRRMARGVGLREGWVPYTVFWSVKPGLPLIVGELHIRHRLVPASEKEGGHIGYTIAPSMRGKGLGTQQLALGLGKARALLGLDRVLVTCDTDNVASTRVIQKNGGVLENEVVSDRSGKRVSRYWIDLVP
jgi:predicted acetyltransferase